MLIVYYDPETFERKGTITKVRSAKWTKRFYDYGSFEIHLQECNVQKYDLILQGIHSGIVMEIEKSIPSGAVIYGCDLKGLADFRYIDIPETFTNRSPEYIFESLAQDFFMSGSRKINGFKIISAENPHTALDSYTTEAQFLSEEFLKLSKQTDVGYDITFDENNISFSAYGVRDNTEVVFSRRKRSLEKASYTNSIFNTYNVVYYTTGDESTAEKGSASGIKRREGYTEKAEDADKFLAEKKEIEAIEAEASDIYTYGTDYRLGDKVTVIFDNLTTEKIITEVAFNYEVNGTKIYPTFGTEKENPIRKLLKG